MPSAGFEPAIPTVEFPHTYALYCTATEIGSLYIYLHQHVTSELNDAATVAFLFTPIAVGESCLKSEFNPNNRVINTVLVNTGIRNLPEATVFVPVTVLQSGSFDGADTIATIMMSGTYTVS
jgi:hypothetical protein